MKLKSLTLTFENCEQIVVSGENVGRFELEDFSGEHYYKQNIDSSHISHHKGVKTVLIEIIKDANVERAPFDEDLNTPYGQKNKHTVFKRIQEWKDITWIDFEIEDCDSGEDPNPCYYVHWKGNDNYKNKGQYNYISKAGNLYVFITDKPFIKHRFKKAVNMKWINDPKNYDKEYKAELLKKIREGMHIPPSYEDWLMRTAHYSGEDTPEVTYEDLARDLEKHAEYLKWLGENYPGKAKEEAMQNFIKIGLYNEDGTPNKEYYPD